MKLIIYVILICLVYSIGVMLYALYAERGWVKTQEDLLARSQSPTRVDGVEQRFNLLNETEKIEFFNKFVADLGTHEKRISDSIDSTFKMTQCVMLWAIFFNFFSVLCVIYLLVAKGKKGAL